VQGSLLVFWQLPDPVSLRAGLVAVRPSAAAVLATAHDASSASSTSRAAGVLRLRVGVALRFPHLHAHAQAAVLAALVHA
jgi:hypothetical protein